MHVVVIGLIHLFCRHCRVWTAAASTLSAAIVAQRAHMLHCCAQRREPDPQLRLKFTA